MSAPKNLRKLRTKSRRQNVIKVVFFILRLAIAIGSVAVLAGTLAIFLFNSFIELMKITFVAIFASVFTPGQKILLHIVAVMAFGAAAWDVHRSTTTATHEILFLPVIPVWFVYYAVCLRRA